MILIEADMIVTMEPRQLSPKGLRSSFSPICAPFRRGLGVRPNGSQGCEAAAVNERHGTHALTLCTVLVLPSERRGVARGHHSGGVCFAVLSGPTRAHG